MEGPLDATKRLQVSYQTVVQLDTGETSGIEVFAELGGVRGEGWHRAGQCLLDAAFEQTMGAAGRVSEVAPAGGTVAVNVDPRCVHRGHDRSVAAAVESAGDRTLVFEVLENRPLGPDQLRVLESWRRLGSLIVVDDYGTGFADPERLEATRWDGVKLDRSLLSRLAGGDLMVLEDLRVVLAGYDYVVAEGVEDRRRASLARSLGASHGQGWFYSRPVRLDT
jgi:EAL domain-containing protein (putative c-di-GMP-specific phosphodiesterase class I)